MATPHKNAQGKWEIVVPIGKDSNGKYKYKHITRNSKAEAAEAAREIQQTETPETVTALSMTVREALDRYIARRERTASPSTLAGYKKYARQDFQELMPLKLSALTDAVCQTAIDNYAGSHSPKSTQNRWRLIHAALKEAKKNINLQVKLPRLLMPEEESLKKYLTAIENTPLEIPVLLAAVCGMRRSEIAALDLDKDVDYENNMIHVRHALVMDEAGRLVLKDPKTDAGDRLIPCPEWVAHKLLKARDNPTYHMLQPNSITNQFHRTAPDYGIKCTFHGLRHYYVSVMTALNVPETYQMARVGHSTPDMLKRYQEYLEHKDVEINEDLMGAFDSFAPTHEESGE